MRVSIQGIKGAFHEEAARTYFSDSIEVVEHMNFEQLIQSVNNGASDFGVMAVENTISGTIHANLSLILQSKLEIVGEIHLRIVQNLAVLPGTKLEDLKQVSSHYMAINQCRDFFNKLQAIQLIDMEDTALSMKQVSDLKDKSKAGIGSKLAAQHYGLEILAESIESNKLNYTRFLVLSKSKQPINKALNKASVHIQLVNQPGVLARILNLIHAMQIDLSKIESMPVVGEPWHYQFYLDLIFTSPDRLNQLLELIRPLTTSIHVMGIYTSQQTTQEKK